VRIATWNVNSVRARLERLLPWLSEVQPDVVCLQETKCEDHVFPREEIEELGYQIAAHGQKTYNGVAILSKRPIEDVSHGFGVPEFDTEARAISATIEDVLVTNVYVVNGREVGHERYDYKLAWLDALGRFLEGRSPATEKVVVCGDFNVTFDDRDVYDPERWRDRILCSTPEREAMQRVLDVGFEDSLRKLTGDTGIFTWWDFRRRGFENGNRGLRIDHHLMSPAAMAACTAVEVDRAARAGKKPSDHAPVIATLS
jgi:exodeoxyribonuclease-3